MDLQLLTMLLSVLATDTGSFDCLVCLKAAYL